MIVAQITDLHIRRPDAGAEGRLDSAAALRHCVAMLNRLDPAPDIVLVTGDLVDDGTAEEYAHMRALMAPLRTPYCVIPGNHDDRDALRAAFADHGYLPRDGMFLHYAIEDFPLRLIGLDSVVAGRARGELCGERLRWLDARLAEQPDRPTLLFLHHPPFLDGIPFWDTLNCRNSPDLAALVRRHPQVVRLIAGHLHQSIHRMWNGVMASSGPSPAPAIALRTNRRGAAFALNPPLFHLHAWDPMTGLVSRPGFVGTPGGDVPIH